jgi:hypothetical protein
MHPRLLLAPGLVAALLLAGCFGTSTQSTPSTSPGGVPARAFGFNATLVDSTLDVSEPSILTDPSGTLWIAGPTGFAKVVVQKDPSSAKHDTALLKSTDHGATWTNVQQVPMYGRDACPGGGDSDITAAPNGDLYLVDLNLANVPIDVSTDHGKTWVFNCNSSIAPGLDRQWVAATNQYVWISVNQLAAGPIVYRSDAIGGTENPVAPNGLVFGPPVQVTHGGAIIVDQASHDLYLAGTGAEIEHSADNGATWTVVPTGLADKGVDLGGSFISIALDRAGDVFVAGSGSDGVVVSGSSDHGKSWTHAAHFKPYPTGKKVEDGEYGFAWVAAGGNGTVGFAWYGWPSANATAPYHMEKAGYYLFAGQSTDLLQKGANATAVYARAYDKPVTTKRLCTGINLVGFVQCDQADPSKTRSLGDFFESGMDNDGNLVISFVDANQPGPNHLMFARQTAGLQAR